MILLSSFAFCIRKRRNFRSNHQTIGRSNIDKFQQIFQNLLLLSVLMSPSPRLTVTCTRFFQNNVAGVISESQKTSKSRCCAGELAFAASRSMKSLIHRGYSLVFRHRYRCTWSDPSPGSIRPTSHVAVVCFSLHTNLIFIFSKMTKKNRIFD